MRASGSTAQEVRSALSRAAEGLAWNVYEYTRDDVWILVCSGRSIFWPSVAPSPADAAETANTVWQEVAPCFGMAVFGPGAKRAFTVNIQAADNLYYGVDVHGIAYGPEENRRMR